MNLVQEEEKRKEKNINKILKKCENIRSFEHVTDEVYMEVLSILRGFGCTNIKNYLNEYIEYLLAAVKIINHVNKNSNEEMSNKFFLELMKHFLNIITINKMSEAHLIEFLISLWKFNVSKETTYIAFDENLKYFTQFFEFLQYKTGYKTQVACMEFFIRYFSFLTDSEKSEIAEKLIPKEFISSRSLLCKITADSKFDLNCRLFLNAFNSETLLFKKKCSVFSLIANEIILDETYLPKPIVDGVPVDLWIDFNFVPKTITFYCDNKNAKESDPKLIFFEINAVNCKEYFIKNFDKIGEFTFKFNSCIAYSHNYVNKAIQRSRIVRLQFQVNSELKFFFKFIWPGFKKLIDEQEAISTNDSVFPTNSKDLDKKSILSNKILNHSLFQPITKNLEINEIDESTTTINHQENIEDEESPVSKILSTNVTNSNKENNCPVEILTAPQITRQQLISREKADDTDNLTVHSVLKTISKNSWVDNEKKSISSQNICNTLFQPRNDSRIEEITEIDEPTPSKHIPSPSFKIPKANANTRVTKTPRTKKITSKAKNSIKENICPMVKSVPTPRITRRRSLYKINLNDVEIKSQDSRDSQVRLTRMKAARKINLVQPIQSGTTNCIDDERRERNLILQTIEPVYELIEEEPISVMENQPEPILTINENQSVINSEQEPPVFLNEVDLANSGQYFIDKVYNSDINIKKRYTQCDLEKCEANLLLINAMVKRSTQHFFPPKETNKPSSSIYDFIVDPNEVSRPKKKPRGRKPKASKVLYNKIPHRDFICQKYTGNKRPIFSYRTRNAEKAIVQPMPPAKSNSEKLFDALIQSANNQSVNEEIEELPLANPLSLISEDQPAVSRDAIEIQPEIICAFLPRFIDLSSSDDETVPKKDQVIQPEINSSIKTRKDPEITPVEREDVSLTIQEAMQPFDCYDEVIVPHSLANEVRNDRTNSLKEASTSKRRPAINQSKNSTVKITSKKDQRIDSSAIEKIEASTSKRRPTINQSKNSTVKNTPKKLQRIESPAIEILPDGKALSPKVKVVYFETSSDDETQTLTRNDQEIQPKSPEISPAVKENESYAEKHSFIENWVSNCKIFKRPLSGHDDDFNVIDANSYRYQPKVLNKATFKTVATNTIPKIFKSIATSPIKLNDSISSSSDDVKSEVQSTVSSVSVKKRNIKKFNFGKIKDERVVSTSNPLQEFKKSRENLSTPLKELTEKFKNTFRNSLVNIIQPFAEKLENLKNGDVLRIVKTYNKYRNVVCDVQKKMKENMEIIEKHQMKISDESNKFFKNLSEAEDYTNKFFDYLHLSTSTIKNQTNDSMEALTSFSQEVSKEAIAVRKKLWNDHLRSTAQRINEHLMRFTF